jgi:hypothetical protein
VSVKYLGVVLLAEYRDSPANTADRNAKLIPELIKPVLGKWLHEICGALSLWLVTDIPSRLRTALVFAQPGRGKAAQPRTTDLRDKCARFVKYRNDALGHGAMRSDDAYAADLTEWLPVLRQLLDAVASLSAERLCLVTDSDRCQVWMGPQPSTAVEPGSFSRNQIGHFVVRGPEGSCRDLYPFICYLPDKQQEKRLHFYDSLDKYSVSRKEVLALEYEQGFKSATAEPIPGLEQVFTADLLAAAFGRQRGSMAIIEGRVAHFNELIEAHADIVGRRFSIEHVHTFLKNNDRGLLVIEGTPGRGKTAFLAHLIYDVFGHCAPPPVHFFYRRTAGITDPDVCVNTLYGKLLQAHNLTESEESKKETGPEPTFLKLVDLLRTIAATLVPGRPQLIFVDALDEAQTSPGGQTSFDRLPEELPAGVYIIATTRPVMNRTVLVRRPYLQWHDLDSPQLLPENLRDGFEYVARELIASDVPEDTIAEIVRAGAGNFLVLKLLCSQIRVAIPPGHVAEFLRKLATDGSADQLGFIYREFWERLASGLSRDDMNVLADIAGLLVTVEAPVTADIICGALHLKAGDWDFALRHVIEYLTVIRQKEQDVSETFYRLYHESFADFVRARRTAGDHARYVKGLTNWREMPAGYAKRYALRWGPRYLVTMEARAARVLLTTPDYLRARFESLEETTPVTSKEKIDTTRDMANDIALVSGHISPDELWPAWSVWLSSLGFPKSQGELAKWLVNVEEVLLPDVAGIRQADPAIDHDVLLEAMLFCTDGGRVSKRQCAFASWAVRIGGQALFDKFLKAVEKRLGGTIPSLCELKDQLEQYYGYHPGLPRDQALVYGIVMNASTNQERDDQLKALDAVNYKNLLYDLSAVLRSASRAEDTPKLQK